MTKRRVLIALFRDSLMTLYTRGFAWCPLFLGRILAAIESCLNTPGPKVGDVHEVAGGNPAFGTQSKTPTKQGGMSHETVPGC